MNIDGELFEKLVVGGASNLKAHIKTVNDLNVFPIPDGDTGDNMYMTLGGGLGGMKAVEANSVQKKAQALADGMLLNARGNSGVILSQLFAGMAKGLEGVDVLNAKTLGAALKMGVKQAYSSVSQPVEGTVLTVAREAADYAADHTEEGCSTDEFFHEYIVEMRKSLDRTPDLLPALKEADVIDSGGAGLLYIIEGMIAVLEGKTVEDVALETSFKSVDFSKFNENSVMTFGYCTEFLLQLQVCKCDPQAFDVNTVIEYLNTIGDSIVAFKTGTIIKVHVHTLTPYRALEFCQQFGEFLTVKIENMTLQHNETGDDFATKKKKKRNRTKYALVTVAIGNGLKEVYTELGANVIIEGGQGQNPSIEKFIEAFDEANADHIFVLPNNSNIIMAARQAKELYKDSEIHVIETKNFGQAYSILSMLDYSSDDPEAIAENMKNDMTASVTGMVTTSIRSACIDGIEINEGDYIGFTDKVMQVARKTKVDAFLALAEKLGAADKSFVITVFGEDVTDEEREAVEANICDSYPGVEFYGIDGGQKVYDFIMILE